MNKALLPILSRLHSLQGASRMSPEGDRIIASRSDPNPITVILREINETILARNLRFTSESGIVLALEVSGRRILRVSAAEGLPGAEDCLAAPALDDEHKDDFLKLLHALAAPRQEIRVRSAPAGDSPEGISVGFPVALIADLLLVELNGLESEVASDAASDTAQAPAPSVAPATAGSLLGRFALGNGSVLMAWLISGGEEDGRVEGPDEMVDHLKAFLDDEVAALGAQLDRLAIGAGQPICIALGAKLSEGHSIICARAEGALLLGLAEGDCTRTLLQAWSAALT